MPGIQQPGLLRDKAMAVLNSIFLEFCRMCRSEGSSAKLRQGIAFVKTEMRPYMTQDLAVKVFNTLHGKNVGLYQLPDLTRTTFLRIVLEALMDERIIGLECTLEILDALRPEDSDRLQGFSELEVQGLKPYSLRKLYLGNIRTVTYIGSCTDLDLVIIGQNCPKLTYIDVSESTEVTDVELCALGLCSNLRYVHVSHCFNVSVAGFKDLLSVNVGIREVFGWKETEDPGFDYFQDPDWASDTSVHTSIVSFTIERDEISDRHTRFFVAKFPNLTSITLNGKLTGDVSILNSLSRLSKINFSFEVQADKIESLLKCLGARIEHMAIRGGRECLNLIFELCKNLEYLRFMTFNRADPRVTLVVPPFQKLKSLICVSYEEGEIQKMEFGQMLSLERIRIDGSIMSRSELESIILDHTNFPSLKIMEITNLSEENDFVHLRKLVKTCNLDLKLRHVGTDR